MLLPPPLLLPAYMQEAERLAEEQAIHDRKEALRMALEQQLAEKHAAKRAEADAEAKHGLGVVRDAEAHVKQQQEAERQKLGMSMYNTLISHV